jgi:hypothetical protein
MNLLRCTRWRVTGRIEHESGEREVILAPADPSSSGVTLELISAAAVKPGDELELSAHLVAVLTGTDHPMAHAGRELARDVAALIPPCGGAIPGAKVPRDSIRWWGLQGLTHHAVEQGKPVRDGLCGVRVPQGATWTELVQERHCCVRCLLRLDYGDAPAAAGP